MKILSIGDFDPCGVAVEHRDALRAIGFDYRMVVRATHRARANDADWIWRVKGDPEELLAFAHAADVVQFHPGIGDQWSWRPEGLPLFDADTDTWLGDDKWPTLRWADHVEGVKVFYFHGSINAWNNLEDYARRYRHEVVWASTIDYASRLGCPLAPPIIATPPGTAPLRGDDDPLVVVHTPTAPKICATEGFLTTCRSLGIVSLIGQNLSHEETLQLKLKANVGFDHLRGCFSVNTLENAAVGLVPLVGLNPEWLPALGEMPAPPVEAIRSLTDLRDVLEFMDDRPDWTAQLQMDAHSWYHLQWHPMAILRMRRLYEGL